MRKAPRSSSVGRLFSRKSRGGQGRPRNRKRPDFRLERLEERRLLAFDLIAAYAQSERPFFLAGSPAEVLEAAPQEITLRFTPGTKVDSTTLGSISIVRSGGATDSFGNGNDVAVMPGSIVVESAPNENEVVIRFAETLPDDSYRIVVGPGLTSQGSVGSVNASSFDFRLDRGAFVQSVVPQPTASINRDGVYQLVHARGQIQVWFNLEDPLAQASAENPAFYRLQRIDPLTNEPIGEVSFPTQVEYRADLGRATIWYREPLKQEGLFRLDIGGSDTLEPVVFTAGSDDNSSFTTARQLGALTARGAIVDAAIESRPTVATPAGALGLPSQPGSVDEPGHRELPVDSGAHGLPYATVDPASGITVIPYNFQHVIGADPQGNTLFNVITDAQKQRAREIFELFSLEAGVRFVETADQGLLVATGDLRAFSPTVPVESVAGLGGPGAGALMNSNINWGDSEYGGSWFRVAMHEIGHALGLEHSYDLNSIMGADLGGEPVFPGDYDFVHLRQLFPQSGSDVDVYAFEVAETGRFSAETIISRPGQPITSTLDSVISLYREQIVNGQPVRTLVARNDDYYGRDSFVGLDLDPGKYFVAVTSTGNTAFDPAVSDSGANGRSEGEYRLSLTFTPLSAETNTIVDRTGRALDGDRDGEAGGVFSFWFQTADRENTIYVDKGSTVPGPGDGTKDNAFKTISAALAAAEANDATKVIRILGKQATPYEIGLDPYGRPLQDGATFNVPAGVTVIIDRAATFKLRNAIIDVGSSSELVSRAGAALQVLGVPNRPAVFTSWHDDSVGGDSDGPSMGAADGGQWGGIVFRGDSDAGSRSAFVNAISNADIRYGGGEVVVDSKVERFAPIQLESSRPTVVFNTITNSAGAAIAATPDSFLDDGERVGPEFRGNTLLGNSVNGLFVKIDTDFGQPLERLTVPARFTSTDVVYVIPENLMIAGGAGGYEVPEGATETFARATGRLAIDPGVVVKLQSSRIELERGVSQLIAEGTAYQQVIFTSLGDNRYGAGGTFDTNGNVPDKFDGFGQPIGDLTVGDWGGIILNAGSRASIDNAYIAFGGGVTPIEGGFDAFNAVEVHQGDLRLANSRVELNASGLAVGNRMGRGSNEPAAVFVRGAQPAIVGNDFRSNLGSVISIDANSLTDQFRPDTGRSTGGIGLVAGSAGNYGPLVQGNRISSLIDTSLSGAGEFDIEVVYDPSLPRRVRTAVEAAVAKWESVIVGDLSPAVDPTTGRQIDDVLIYVQSGLLGGLPSDGPGNALANAGPREFRAATDANPYLPYVAEVGIDMSDVGNFANELTSILIHEFGHALGFTSVSEYLSLITGADYVGVNALREYQRFVPGATGVPMEQGGGAGTAYAHWDEATFGNELMTGFIDTGINPLSRISVGAFADMGYTVDYAAADAYVLPGFTGTTPPLPGGPVVTGIVNGMTVRGGEITVESVWDDTGVVHVVQDEIFVGNFHTATGLRLLSDTDASLVVKLAGETAGLTASGYGLDINDRIGGTVQVIGQPGYPVVLTSLADDTIGAGLDPIGVTVTDTNNDSDRSEPAPADWRSLQFLPFSNDRNVAVVIESEATYTARLNANGVPANAEWLGVLAPNFPTGTNSWESAAEKSGDSNRRLGFEVHGSIAFDHPGDVDVYSFTGHAGSEVWIDIDNTSPALDTMVELLDASGRVLARSIDSIAEGVVVPSDTVFDFVGGESVTYQLANAGVLPGTLAGTLYDFGGILPLPIQTFTVDAAGVVTFRTVHNAAEVPAVTGGFDAATGLLTINFAGAAGQTVIDARYSYATGGLAAVGGQATVAGQDAWLGGDFYSTNPKNAGMRVILPGTRGNQVSYFLRVRSQPRYEPVATDADNGGLGATTKSHYEADLVDPALLTAGATSGRYELRVRLQQRDEKPGSTVRFADIRYATIGIDAEGLPSRSLLVGEGGEAGDAANVFGGAQYLGNLLQSDLGALSVAGSISDENDVDWYTFAVNYEQIQSIPGANAGPYFAATMFDIDYADGFRGDLTISVFDETGQLIYVGRDSNVADDQAGVGQGNDFDDLSRGSIGELDPYIGSVELVAGGPTGSGGGESGGVISPPDPARQLRYYVAISSNERLPAALDATFFAGATNSLIRLEPVNSVRRIVEDHIGSVGYTDFGGTEHLPTTGAIIDLEQLDLHVTPFRLGDVTLYVSSPGGVTMRDPVSGQAEGVVNDTAFNNTPLADLDMRPDGRLFAYAGVNNNNGTAGRLIEINPVTGQIAVIGDDQIPNVDGDNPLNFQTSTNTVRALAFRVTDWAEFEELWFVVADGPESKLYRAANGGTTAGTPDATANQAWEENSQNLLGYRGRIALDGEYPTVTGVQFTDDVRGPLYGVTADGRLITIQPGNKIPEDGAPADDGGPLIDFDAQATLVVDFADDLATIGARGFTALAAAPQNLHGGALQGKFFALTDNGRLALLDPEATTLEWVVDSGEVGLLERTGDTGGSLYFQGDTSAVVDLAGSPLVAVVQPGSAVNPTVTGTAQAIGTDTRAVVVRQVRISAGPIQRGTTGAVDVQEEFQVIPLGNTGGIEAGMLIVGEDVPYGTTVLDINDDGVVVDLAFDVSGVADGTGLSFYASVGQGTGEVLNVNDDDTAEVAVPTDGLTSGLAAGMWVAGGGLTEPTTIVAVQLVPAPAADRIVVVLSAAPGDPAAPLQFFGATEITGIDPADDGLVVGVSTLTYDPGQANYDLRIPKGTAVDGNSLNQPVGEFQNELVDVYSGVAPVLQGVKDGGLYVERNAAGEIVSGSYVLMADVPVVSLDYFIPGGAPGAAGPAVRGEYYTVVAGQGAVTATAGLTLDTIVLANTAGLVPGLLVIGGGVGLDQEATILAVDAATNTVQLSAIPPDLNQPFWFYGVNQLSFASGLLPEPGADVEGADVPTGITVEYAFPSQVDRTLGGGGLVSVAGGVFVPGQTGDVTLADLAITTADLTSLEPGMRIVGESVPAGIWISEVDDRYVWVAPAGILADTFPAEELTYIRPTWGTTLAVDVIAGLIQVTVADAKGINVGMLVSGPGFQAGTLVTGVNSLTNTVTLSKRTVEAEAGRPVFFYLTAGEYLSTVGTQAAWVIAALESVVAAPVVGSTITVADSDGIEPGMLVTGTNVPTFTVVLDELVGSELQLSNDVSGVTDGTSLSFYSPVSGMTDVMAQSSPAADTVVLPSVAGLLPGLIAVGGGLSAEATILSVDPTTRFVRLSVEIPDPSLPLSFFGSNRLVFETGTLPAVGVAAFGPGVPQGVTVATIAPKNGDLSLLEGGVAGLSAVLAPGAVVAVSDYVIPVSADSGLERGMRLRGASVPDGIWIREVADGYAWLSGPSPLGAFTNELVTVIEPTGAPVLAAAGAVGDRIVTLDDVSEIERGMQVSGFGVAVGTVVAEVNGDEVTLTRPLTQAAATGQSVFFYRSSGWVPSASDPVPLASTVPQPHARGNVVVGVLDASELTVGMNVYGDSVLPGTTLLAFDADSYYVWLSDDLTDPPASVDLRFSTLDDATNNGTVVRVASPYSLTDGGVETGMVVFGPGILPGTTVVGFQDASNPALIGGGVAQIDAVLGSGQEVTAQTAAGEVTGTAAALAVPGSGYRRVTIAAVPVRASVAEVVTGTTIPVTTIAGILPGMLARGPGIPYGTVITGVNPAGVQGGPSTVSVSNPVNGLAVGSQISFYSFVGEETVPESQLTINPDGTAQVELLLNDGVTDSLVSGLAAGMWVTGAGLDSNTRIVSIRVPEATADRLVITLSQVPPSFVADPSDFTQPLSFWGVSTVTGLDVLTANDDGKLVGTSTLAWSATGDYDLRIPLGTSLVAAGGAVSLSQPVGEFTSRQIDIHGGVTPSAAVGIEPGMLLKLPGAAYGSVVVRVDGSPVFTAPAFFDATAVARGGVGEYFAPVTGQSDVVATAGETAATIVLAGGVAGLQPGMRVVGGGFTTEVTILSVDPDTNAVTLSADAVDLARPFSFFGVNRVEFAAGAIPAVGDGISGDGVPADATVTGVFATGLTLSQAPRTTGTGVDVRLIRPAATVAATLTRDSAEIEVPAGTAVTVGMVALGLGIPAGSFVTDVAGQTITLSRPAEYTAVRNVSFVAVDLTRAMTPVPTATDVLSGNLAGLHAGMLVFGQGVPANTVIASVSGNRIRLSQPITTGDGQYAFIRDGRVVSLAPPTATVHLAVGQEVTGSGVTAGTTVAAVGTAAAGTITLSQAAVAGRTANTLEFITRDDTGAEVVNRRVVGGLADTSTLRPGLVVFGPGIAGNTTIASVDDANGITLSQEADLRGEVELAFLSRQDIANPTVVRTGTTTAGGTGIELPASDLRVDMFVISDDLPGWFGRITAKTADSITLSTAVEPGLTASFKFLNVSTVSYLADWTGDRNFSEIVGNGTGIAFSTLDVNLWHPTVRRGDVTNDSVPEADPGHGINPTTDLSRQEARDQGRGTTNGGTSMYFGLEQWVSSNAAYGGYAPGGQYGVANPAWQRYLTEGTGRGNTYDLPGGAYGSLTTNSFSLEGYTYTDKPTVYFNYWLQTENAEGTPANNAMRDSARVFISKDDGLTWELIATNNSVRNTSDSELATYASVSTRIDGEPGIQDPRQQVQELFDTSDWRQARIDLGEYAGQANLRFRFDFSTAGEMNPQQVDAAGAVLGSAALSGNFQNGPKDGNWRGTANNYEGFYVDDIMVGFAERGEMVTGATAQTAFFDVNTPDPVTAPSQSLSGPYQLEIRRGSEYAEQIPSGSTIYQLFDTNDRLIPSQGNSSGFGATIGDQNQPRQQGQFIVEDNVISYSSEYGISIDAGIRDGGSNAAHPGTVRNLPTLNNARLVPGAVVRNNVINEFGTAGILFSGDANTGTVPTAPVPFGRIVNNTIYGGETQQGTGILVTQNAGPTLLNNLFANLATGVSIDASSRARTVVGMGAYSGTGTRVAGGTETGGIQIEDAPFVNPSARNFYLIAGSRAIDSSLNSLQDRPEFTAVNSAIGVPPSPILAPDYDVYGQLRADDPGVTNLSGLGSNVFKDRGAVDRVDFVRPLMSLALPLDGGPLDMNSGFDAVRVTSGGANTLTRFELQLVDAGSGIDPATVVAEAFTLTRNGQLLTEGVDYLFRFLPATGRVVFEAASVYPLGTYVINATSRPSSALVGGLLTDRANNTLLPNKTDGSTSFLVEIGAVPAAPTGLVGTVGDRQVMLEWTAPVSDGPVFGYRVRWQVAGSGLAGWTPWIDTGSTATTFTVGPDAYPLMNATAYSFEVLAVNGYGEGPAVFAGPLTPRVPASAPESLAAAASTGPYQTGVVNLSWSAPSMPAGETLLDYKVEYRPVGSTNWTRLSPDPVGLDPAAAVYGLVNGRTYEYRVTTVTSLGDGLGATAAATTVGLPQVPTAVVATTGDKAATIAWNPVTGEATGGSPITAYRVEWSANGTNWAGMDVAGTATIAVVTGLANNTTYVVRVAARNAQGQGFFAPAATTVTPQELSGPPTRLTGLAGNGTVSLVWTAPQPSVLAGPITDYVIQASSDYAGDVHAATWVTLPDGVSTLTRATVSVPNGVSHVFRVAAVTKNGVGAFSLPSPSLYAFDPTLLPNAPLVTTATSPQAGRAKLTWSAPPANGGAPVTGYVVRYRLAGTETWRTVSRTNEVVVFQGLVSGQDYQFQVRAESATGLGALSDLITIRVL